MTYVLYRVQVLTKLPDEIIYGSEYLQVIQKTVFSRLQLDDFIGIAVSTVKWFCGQDKISMLS